MFSDSCCKLNSKDVVDRIKCKSCKNLNARLQQRFFRNSRVKQNFICYRMTDSEYKRVGKAVGCAATETYKNTRMRVCYLFSLALFAIPCFI